MRLPILASVLFCATTLLAGAPAPDPVAEQKAGEELLRDIAAKLQPDFAQTWYTEVSIGGNLAGYSSLKLSTRKEGEKLLLDCVREGFIRTPTNDQLLMTLTATLGTDLRPHELNMTMQTTLAKGGEQKQTQHAKVDGNTIHLTKIAGDQKQQSQAEMPAGQIVSSSECMALLINVSGKTVYSVNEMNASTGKVDVIRYEVNATDDGFSCTANKTNNRRLTYLFDKAGNFTGTSQGRPPIVERVVSAERYKELREQLAKPMPPPPKPEAAPGAAAQPKP